MDNIILIIYLIALFCFIAGIIFSRLSFLTCKKIIEKQVILINNQNKLLGDLITLYNQSKEKEKDNFKIE